MTAATQTSPVSRSPRSVACAQWTLVALFLLCLAAPWLDRRPASARGPGTEGRAAHAFPVWKRGEAWPDNFTRHFERAFSDALGLRDFLLRWHNHFELDLLRFAPSSIVLLGEDDWLFYTGESSVEMWRGIRPLSESQLAVWQQVLEARRDRARSLGADYLFVLGPNKESIYPEKLPEGYEPLGPTRFDQLLAWMGAHSDVALVDLRPCMRAARAEDTPQHALYYEEGTHWHGRGCMAAAREILRRVGERFPALAELPPTEWRMESEWPPETWRTKMYLEPLASRLRDEWRPVDGKRRARQITADAGAPLKHFEQLVTTPGLPSAVLFHDSFGPGVLSLLAEPFAKLASEHTNSFDDALVASERPELVIELFVERVLALPDPLALLPQGARVGADAGEARTDPSFDGSTDLRLRCDADTPTGDLECGESLTFQARRSPPSPGLLLHSQGPAGTLTFPELGAGSERDLVLRLDLTSPGPCQGTLYFTSGAGEAWSDGRSLPLAFERGRNRIDLRLAAGEHVRRLRLRPGQAAGSICVLHSAEVRAVDAR